MTTRVAFLEVIVFHIVAQLLASVMNYIAKGD